MKRIVTILALCIGTNLYAQREDDSYSLLGNRSYIDEVSVMNRRVNTAQNLDVQRTKKGNKKESLQLPDSRYSNDTLYCRVIANRRGWYIPAGDTVSGEQARHVNQCFRFTERTNKGLWMHIESLDGYGKYSDNHKVSIYLFDKEARGADNIPTKIKEKFSEVVQWTCKENRNGEVIQQRGYDKNGDLVYSYNITWKDRGTSVGQYTDAWGIPLKLVSDSVYNTALPVVKYNVCGYDSLVSYVDEYGFSVHNANGVYKNIYETDAYGRLLKSSFCNEFGQLIKSKVGYSKLLNIIDEKGRVIERHFYDEQNKPIKPSKDSYSDYVYTPTIKAKYDNYGNWTDVFYYDGEMKPDTLDYGVHHVHRHFNESGKVTLLTTYGLDGKHCAYYSSGEAFNIRKYDNKGRVVYQIFLQSDSLNIIHDGDQYIESFYTYDSKGNAVSRDRYSWVDEKKFLCLQTRLDTISGKEIQIKYYPATKNHDAYYQRSEYDADDLLSLRCFYSTDSMRKQITEDYRGYYTYKRIKDNINKDIEIQTKMFLDSCGSLVMPVSQVADYALSITKIDSISCVKHYKKIDNQRKVLNNYFNKYLDKTFSTIEYRQQLNFADVPARSAGTGLLYYRAKHIDDVYGDIVSDVGYNEWGEPALICKELYGYYYKAREGDEIVYYNENNTKIDRSEFYDNAPKALIVEVIDSIAYRYGLKDGDVIVRFGDAVLNTTWGNDIPLHFCSEAIRLASTTKSMWVIRHNIKEKNSEVIKIELPKGTLSQMGFTIHTQFYTETENDRFSKICKRDSLIIGNGNHFVQDDNNQTTAYMIYPSKLDEDVATCYFKYGMKDPMYILRIEALTTDEDGNDHYRSYSIGDPWIKCKSLIWHDEDEAIKMILYVTSDGQTVHKICKDLGFRASDAFCNPVELFPSQLEQLQKLDISLPYDPASELFEKSDFMNLYNEYVKH